MLLSDPVVSSERKGYGSILRSALTYFGIINLVVSSLYFYSQYATTDEAHISHVEIFRPHDDAIESAPPSDEVAFETPSIQAQLAATALRQLCDSTDWTEGLWLQCHNFCGPSERASCGGLNNARNRAQTCLRLAIDAGAGLIMANISLRNETDLNALHSAGEVCSDDFWDREHLVATMADQCPQLALRFCGDNSGMQEIYDLPPRKFVDGLFKTGTFHEAVQGRLADVNMSSVSAENPIAVNYGDPFVIWDYNASNELATIRKALFLNLSFAARLLKLGTQILESPELKNGFVGVHWRGENDWPDFFGTKEQQLDLYIPEIEHFQSTISQPIKDVYVACGNRSAIDILRRPLEKLGYTVHDKWTLLADRPELLAEIDALPFDQKGITEYPTLTNSAHFLGLLSSTLSLLIAFARHVDDSEDYFETYIYPGTTKEDPIDGLKRIFPGGPHFRGNDRTSLMVFSVFDPMDQFPK